MFMKWKKNHDFLKKRENKKMTKFQIKNEIKKKKGERIKEKRIKWNEKRKVEKNKIKRESEKDKQNPSWK